MDAPVDVLSYVIDRLVNVPIMQRVLGYGLIGIDLRPVFDVLEDFVL